MGRVWEHERMPQTPEPPHDVLAAEEFALPAPDPRLQDQHARDVLAAEEFALPAPDPDLQTASAHDVLAAEEFVLPAPDPDLQTASAHDVLAAEEFVLPAPDLRLAAGTRPLVPPADPYDPAGREPAHDVLAAEEFAVPGTVGLRAAAALTPDPAPAPGARRVIPWVAALLALVTLRRRRARR